MFDKKEKASAPEISGKTNRIVEGTKIKGDINTQGDFRLDGELLGNFTSTGKLVIGPEGSIIGDIVCKNCDIEGAFNGKLDIDELLNIKSRAKIKGEVLVGKLSIEPGAEFIATCSMKSVSSNFGE